MLPTGIDLVLNRRSQLLHNICFEQYGFQTAEIFLEHQMDDGW